MIASFESSLELNPGFNGYIVTHFNFIYHRVAPKLFSPDSRNYKDIHNVESEWSIPCEHKNSVTWGDPPGTNFNPEL